MGAPGDAIISLLAVKIKPRQDGYSDQFIRIVMLKTMLAGALITGLNWYSDKINCIMEEGVKKEIGDFVSSACWINGLYVYKEIRFHDDKMGYYGIPRDINLDGRDSSGHICATTDGGHRVNPDCTPMTKSFYVQYQYITFLLTAVALLYYVPYAIFRKVNEDKTSLKTSIADNNADMIVENYFNDKVNPRSKLRLRVAGDVIVKILYVIATVGAFVIINSTLNGDFAAYGGHWLDWSKLQNALAYDYTSGVRQGPKPGDELLPSYGFCEIHESAQDIKMVVTNKHRFVCELSQHILYQYIFIIIWFVMVASIIVAVLGLLHQVVEIFITMFCKVSVAPGKPVYKALSFREVQYLEFIRRKSMPLYGEVMAKLRDQRQDEQAAAEKEKLLNE